MLRHPSSFQRALSLPLRHAFGPSKLFELRGIRETPQTLGNNNARRFSKSCLSPSHRDQLLDKIGLQQGRDEHLERVDCDSLTPKQLEGLFNGEFPTDHPKDFIQLKGLPYQDYRRIQSAFEKSNARKTPSNKVIATFNSKFTTTSIQRGPPVPIYQQTLLTFERFMRHQYSRDDNQIYTTSVAEPIGIPVPGYAGTNKTPDLQLEYQASGSLQVETLVFVGEVGFLQSYSSLVQTMTTYLEGLPTVGMGIILKYDEKPDYRNPAEAKRVDPVLRDRLLHVNAEEPPHVTKQDPEDPYSPLFLNGLRWAGRLRGFFEVWIRDAERKAMRRGDRINFMGYGENPANLSIPYNDFIPSPTDLNRTIEIDWELLRLMAEKARLKLAVARFKKHVYNIQKKPFG